MKVTILGRILLLVCVLVLIGTSVYAAPNFCPNCGAKIGTDKNYKYCPNCGYDFNKGNANTGAAPPANPAVSAASGFPVPWTGEGVSISLVSPTGSRLIPYRGHKISYDQFLAKSRGEYLYQREEMSDLKGLFTCGDMIYVDFNYSDNDRRRMMFAKSEFNIPAGIPEYDMRVMARGITHRGATPFNYPTSYPDTHRGHFRSWNVRKNMEVKIYFEENGWYYAEYFSLNDYGNGPVQLWIPKDIVILH